MPKFVVPKLGVEATPEPRQPAPASQEPHQYDSPTDQTVHNAVDMLDDKTKVMEITHALIREHLSHHKVSSAREAFDAECPKTENSIKSRSVVRRLLNVQNGGGGKNGPSVLEALVASIVCPGGEDCMEDPYGSPQGQIAYHGNAVEIGGLMISDEGAHAVNASSEKKLLVERLSDLEPIGAATVELGRGAGGRVMLLKHNKTGTHMAVKEITIDRDEAVQQIQSELKVLYQSTCPYVTKLHGVFWEAGCMFIAMERMEKSLYDAFDVMGPFSEQVTQACVYQILQALHFLHVRRKQIHRDVKPHNILYNMDGWAKLSDFGITSDRVGTFDQGKRDTYCGTLLYMHPERVEGASYSFESDIWALGITIFQLVTGRLPVEERSFIKVSELKHNPPRLPTAFSDDMQDFVSKCLRGNSSDIPGVEELQAHPWVANVTQEWCVSIMKPWAEGVRSGGKGGIKKEFSLSQYDSKLAAL